MTIHVVKRNGTREPLDIEKFHKVIAFACDGLSGVSVSEIALKSQIQLYDGITSRTLMEATIKSAADLISEDAPNYQYVAGRLVSYQLRKEVYGTFKPPKLFDIVKKNVAAGFYDNELLTAYSEQEWDTMEKFVHHDRDMRFTYAAMEQFRGKYLVRNRVTGVFYETPQVAYACIAASLFSSSDPATRLDWIKDFYDATSGFIISLPTPIMAGVRTPQRQYSSCVVLASGDSLNSINTTAAAIVRYVSQKAGIGVDVSRIRAIGSPIRNGDASHTGIIPFIKYFHSAVKSCSQGGVRGGAATCYFPIWHLEVEDLLVLKNNKGTEETRVRHLDYGVQFNRVFYERLLSNGNITLFSPNDVKEMYDAFFVDVDKFRVLYEAAEANPNIRKKVVKASDLFSTFMGERKDTGRIYLINVDHANDHGSFVKEKAPITQSNLCAEITLPSYPLESFDDEDGVISLCTLAAINWGNIKAPEEFEKAARLTVRALDALLDYQGYPVTAAKRATLAHRPLGVGIINFAYWMAKNNLSYQNIDAAGLALIHRWTEAWSYYLIKASVELAKEKGACWRIEESKYASGILPIDTYKKEVDELVEPVYYMDWAGLRTQLKTHGIRNATLMALMPSESSSIVSNATNGIEPPRALVSVKVSKDGVMRQVVPGIRKLKTKYDLLWDQKSPLGYLKIVAVVQKFVDQSISTNTSYNPQFYDEEKIPMSELLQHLLFAYKYGLKTLYYFQTYDGQGEIDVHKVATEDSQEDCESCKI